MDYSSEGTCLLIDTDTSSCTDCSKCPIALEYERNRAQEQQKNRSKAVFLVGETTDKDIIFGSFETPDRANEIRNKLASVYPERKFYTEMVIVYPYGHIPHNVWNMLYGDD